jgi:O-antigen/teichoic acid export membrane protein
MKITNSHKNYILTFITEFLILVAGLFVYKLASSYFSKIGFSEYALCRRSVSFVLPLMMLGMGVGIPRYISLINSNTAKVKTGSYFIIGLIILLILFLVCFSLLNILKDSFAYLMFGDVKYNYLIFPISVVLGGSVFHAACYSFYRGKLQMIKANILQLINLGIIPVIVFFIAKDIQSIFLYTGIAIFFITALFFVKMFSEGLKYNKSYFKPCGRELLLYGVQRVPGDIGIAAFFSIPAFIASHISGIQTAGYVAFGISLLNMAGATFGPICLIVLPEAGNIISGKDMGRLKGYSDKILKWTFIITVIGLLIFELFADFIIKIYLGNSYFEMIAISRIIMISSLGYTVYISLRSILDAFYIKAINTKNIFISFILFILLMVIFWFTLGNYWSVIYSFVISMLLLGLLTKNEVKKIFKSNIR